MHPDLFDVVDLDAVARRGSAKSRCAMPGASWPRTVTKNDDGATSAAVTTG